MKLLIQFLSTEEEEYKKELPDIQYLKMGFLLEF